VAVDIHQQHGLRQQDQRGLGGEEVGVRGGGASGEARLAIFLLKEERTFSGNQWHAKHTMPQSLSGAVTTQHILPVGIQDYQP